MVAKRELRLWASVVVCALAVSTAAGNSLILNVPDWNQPASYNPPGGGTYPNWCVPTSAGNVMGYWEDVKGKTGLADQSAYPANPVPPVNPPFNYPANAGTWKQGLFIDGAAELGWFLDTDGWRTAAGPFPPTSPPLGIGGTALGAINPQVTAYAQSAWADPGGLNKAAYQASITTDTWGNVTLANMWNTYQAEIDAGRPVLCSFGLLVIPDPNGQTGQQWAVNGQNVFEYAWNPSGMPHTVVGVGYIDLNPAGVNINDDWFITQDTWGTTTRYVAVPVLDPQNGAGNPPFGPTDWRQNDYVTIGQGIDIAIPEPASAVLVLLAMPAVAARLRRRVRARA